MRIAQAAAGVMGRGDAIARHGRALTAGQIAPVEALSSEAIEALLRAGHQRLAPALQALGRDWLATALPKPDAHQMTAHHLRERRPTHAERQAIPGKFSPRSAD